jgi:hypothetical protein
LKHFFEILRKQGKAEERVSVSEVMTGDFSAMTDKEKALQEAYQRVGA